MFEALNSNFLIAQCANVVVPDATEQAMRYYNSGNLLWIAQRVEERKWR